MKHKYPGAISAGEWEAKKHAHPTTEQAKRRVYAVLVGGETVDAVAAREGVGRERIYKQVKDAYRAIRERDVQADWREGLSVRAAAVVHAERFQSKEEIRRAIESGDMTLRAGRAFYKGRVVCNCGKRTFAELCDWVGAQPPELPACSDKRARAAAMTVWVYDSNTGRPEGPFEVEKKVADWVHLAGRDKAARTRCVFDSEREAYAAYVADLERRRNRLDRTISQIKSEHGLT